MTAVAEVISGPECARQGGVTYRQLDHWTRQGVLRPAVDAHGSGSNRRYDPSEVTVCRALVPLTSLALNGVGTIVLAEVAAAIRDNPDCRWVRIHPASRPTTVDAPEADGALYLSVNAAAPEPLKPPGATVGSASGRQDGLTPALPAAPTDSEGPGHHPGPHLTP